MWDGMFFSRTRTAAPKVGAGRRHRYYLRAALARCMLLPALQPAYRLRGGCVYTQCIGYGVVSRCCCHACLGCRSAGSGYVEAANHLMRYHWWNCVWWKGRPLRLWTTPPILSLGTWERQDGMRATGNVWERQDGMRAERDGRGINGSGIPRNQRRKRHVPHPLFERCFRTSKQGTGRRCISMLAVVKLVYGRCCRLMKIDSVR